MEESKSPRIIRTILTIIVFIIVVLFLFGKYGVGPEASLQERDISLANTSINLENVVVVENTPMVNGVLTVPKGLPQDIPVELGDIQESSVTTYPKNLRQMSLVYLSKKTLSNKYEEYKKYMAASLYALNEKNDGNSKIIAGTRDSSDLTISVRPHASGTLVTISYLEK